MELKLTVQSTEESLPYVIEVAEGVVRKYGMGREDASKIQLIIDEAVCNSIKYAYPEGQEGIIEIIFSLGEDKFSISVQDFGKGINQDKLRVYDVDDIDSISASHGRGFFLMQAMTDEFEIESEPDKGTKVIMAKYVGRKEYAAQR